MARMRVAALLALAFVGPAAAQVPYGYGLGTGGYGRGLNGSLSGRATGPGEGSRAAGGDGVVRGGAAARPIQPVPAPGRPMPR